MLTGSTDRIGALGAAPRDVLEALLASIPDAGTTLAIAVPLGPV